MTEAMKEDIQKVPDSIKDETGKLTEVAAMAVKNASRGVPASQNLELTTPHIATYADALNSHLPTAHLSTLAKTRVRERQVLIERDPTIETNHMQALMECDW